MMIGDVTMRVTELVYNLKQLLKLKMMTPINFFCQGDILWKVLRFLSLKSEKVTVVLKC